MTPTRARLKEIAALARRRERARLGQFLVEGVRSVEAAVQAGAPLLELLVTDEAAADPRVVALVGAAGVPVHRIPAHEMARLADVQHAQGVAAVARSVVADLAPAGAPALAGPVVALDGVQDPGNVGTLIRTAAWFGATHVVVGPGTADPESPKVVRAAMGGLWDVALHRTGDLPGVVAALVATGRPAYGADLDGEPAAAWAPPRDAVLVLGSEAHGLGPDVAAALSGRVTIAGAGARGVESLNVGVAGAILLHCWLGRG